MIYDVLYDSTLAIYRRQRIRAKYLDFYAITSLVAMEFLNGLSLIALLSFLNVGSVRAIFHDSSESMIISVLLAALLLLINVVYLRFRAHSRRSLDTQGSRSHWIASVYMVCSVALVIYASALVSAFRR